MLRRFLYLDNREVNGYLSSLEGGLVSERTETATDSKQHSYGADIEIVKGDRGKSSESSKSLTKEDTPEARFTRLHEALMSDPEGTGFVEVLEPDVAPLKILGSER